MHVWPSESKLARMEGVTMPPCDKVVSPREKPKVMVKDASDARSST